MVRARRRLSSRQHREAEAVEAVQEDLVLGLLQHALVHLQRRAVLSAAGLEQGRLADGQRQRDGRQRQQQLHVPPAAVRAHDAQVHDRQRQQQRDPALQAGQAGADGDAGQRVAADVAALAQPHAGQHRQREQPGRRRVRPGLRGEVHREQAGAGQRRGQQRPARREPAPRQQPGGRNDQQREQRHDDAHAQLRPARALQVLLQRAVRQGTVLLARSQQPRQARHEVRVGAPVQRARGVVGRAVRQPHLQRDVRVLLELLGQQPVEAGQAQGGAASQQRGEQDHGRRSRRRHARSMPPRAPLPAGAGT